ncbi:4'-phosphopantetheinyl transferase family protein [Sphingobacterium lactis]|uniref:4'-phosphopantetheinyl transferase family protein n=2 Tax=Sphingobacterium TaxID=28453 RepID=UPI003EC588B2
MLKSDHIKLCSLNFNSYNKPYLNGLNFNISHSKNKVVCAISKKFEVGIDIESIKRMDCYPVECCFTKSEIDYINSSKNACIDFYKLWCRKEAAIKADGRGLNIDPRSFEVINSNINIDQKLWSCFDLKLDPSYACCLCLNRNGDWKKNYKVHLLALSPVSLSMNNLFAHCHIVKFRNENNKYP